MASSHNGGGGQRNQSKTNQHVANTLIDNLPYNFLSKDSGSNNFQSNTQQNNDHALNTNLLSHPPTQMIPKFHNQQQHNYSMISNLQ